MPAERPVPPLRESGMRETASGGPIASALENESMRRWRLLDGPVASHGRTANGLELGFRHPGSYTDDWYRSARTVSASRRPAAAP